SNAVGLNLGEDVVQILAPLVGRATQAVGGLQSDGTGVVVDILTGFNGDALVVGLDAVVGSHTVIDFSIGLVVFGIDILNGDLQIGQSLAGLGGISQIDDHVILGENGGIVLVGSNNSFHSLVGILANLELAQAQHVAFGAAVDH